MARSPLYDIYDPYGLLEQQAQFGMLPGDQLGESRNPTLSDLMPQEQQQGLLHTLANAGASGLSGLGWLLDTPGSIIRGALSGGPLKGLSALWESSDDRVTGRELLRQYGMVGDEDTWGNFGGGLAAELLLDPLTYASFGLNAVLGRGAKTAAGKAAAKAGVLRDFELAARAKGLGPRQAYRQSSIKDILADTPFASRQSAIDRLRAGTPALRSDAAFDALRTGNQSLAGADAAAYELLTAPLAKSNRLGVPFFSDGAVDLYGKRAGDALAKAGDYLGEGLMTNPVTGPVARGLTAAFDRDVKGFLDYDSQWEARRVSAAERVAGEETRAKMARVAYEADQQLAPMGLSLADPGLSSQLREIAELGDNAIIQPEYAQAVALPGVKAMLGVFEAFQANRISRARDLGVPLDAIKSKYGTKFFPRSQLMFDRLRKPKWPDGVVPPDRDPKPYTKGSTPAPLTDNFGRSRREYTDIPGGARTMNQLSRDAQLQELLRSADKDRAQEILQAWEQDNKMPVGLYDWVNSQKDGEYIWNVPDLPADNPLVKERAALAEEVDALEASGDAISAASKKKELESLDGLIAEQARASHQGKLYGELADRLRSLDPQHAELGQPFYGVNFLNDMSRYVRGRSRVEASADALLDIMRSRAEMSAADEVIGGVNYTADEALKKLGFTGEKAGEVLARRLGVPSVQDVSFNKKWVDDWARRIERGAAPPELSPLIKGYDDFTKSFKTLALLWPSRYTRDKYSGSFAAASIGAFNPLDEFAAYQMRKGDYSWLARRTANAPGYEGLSAENRIKKFLSEAAANELGVSTYADDIASGATGSKMREVYIGQSKPKWSDIAKRFYNKDRSTLDFLSDMAPWRLRTAAGNRNPILELGDRAAETTDAMNRYGSYLTMIRQGYAPSEAKRLTDLTQVDYGRATDFENRYLKRLIPFYSYTRGITPYIADQVLNNPAGPVGLSTRIINRAGEPSEDTFIPDYLRQTASIPLGGDPDSNLRRFLTNIDLPFESTINLFTPGSGNTLYDKVTDSIRRTAMNFAGQMNPVIKGPLEQLTNRQFYSGREMSDLYSTLEQTLGSPGRAIEQIGYNLPGGSRLIGAYRQLTDDRLDPLDKYFKFGVNALTGVKLQDVDMERTRRLAARNMLTQMLETTPGVRTYENITVPEDVLRAMPEQQRQLYLLYKIIQSEAARKGRERKKAEAALDPMQMLGVG